LTRDRAVEIWQFVALRPLCAALFRFARKEDEDTLDILLDEMADRAIDAFVELGMLKLDEEV
jgi:hypothetical protein